MEQRTFPSLTATNNVIVDRFYLLRTESAADSLDDELIVILGVESDEHIVFVNTGFHSLVVVPNACEIACISVLDRNEEIISENLAVINTESDFLTSYLV